MLLFLMAPVGVLAFYYASDMQSTGTSHNSDYNEWKTREAELFFKKMRQGYLLDDDKAEHEELMTRIGKYRADHPDEVRKLDGK